MRLFVQRNLLRQKLNKIEKENDAMVRYMTSPKFKWPADYVRTWEVIEFIRRINTIIYEYEESMQ